LARCIRVRAGFLYSVRPSHCFSCATISSADK
jgi:hypothetical protein